MYLVSCTKDALFVWTNLGKYFVSRLVTLVKHKDGHKTHYASRRFTIEHYASRRTMRLVPVFILVTYYQTNYNDPSPPSVYYCMGYRKFQDRSGSLCTKRGAGLCAGGRRISTMVPFTVLFVFRTIEPECAQSFFYGTKPNLVVLRHVNWIDNYCQRTSRSQSYSAGCVLWQAWY